jgi:hypothetical protein
MSEFCQDRDLLGIEPGLFLSAGPAGSLLISGTNGQLTGTSFASSAGDFSAAGLEAGMVLVAYTTTPSEGRAYEIVSIDGPHQLTVSVLRAAAQDPPIAPPAGSGLAFAVVTYKPQIRQISAALAEKLRAMVEASPIASASYADSAQLRLAAALGTLASVFLARAESPAPADPNWAKAEHYRQEFARMQMQLRLAIDADGDGFAEQTRTLGNVTLRRT